MGASNSSPILPSKRIKAVMAVLRGDADPKLVPVIEGVPSDVVERWAKEAKTAE